MNGHVLNRFFRIAQTLWRGLRQPSTGMAPGTDVEVRGKADELTVPSVPAFIVAMPAPRDSITHDSRGTPAPEDRDRDPARLLARLEAFERARKGSKLGGAYDGADAAARRERDGEEVDRIIATLDARTLTLGLARLRARQAGEHLVHFGDPSGRVVKVTKPGELGAEELGLEGYLQRMAWSNELLGDDVTVEGWALMPGEDARRLVTTQPEYFPDPERPEPTQLEIDVFMRAHDFLKAYAGAYLHETRDIVASDAVPKNFVRIRGGRIFAIDVVLLAPTAEQHERLTNQVYNTIQMPKR
jgi:hypothetical protein